MALPLKVLEAWVGLTRLGFPSPHLLAACSTGRETEIPLPSLAPFVQLSCVTQMTQRRDPSSKYTFPLSYVRPLLGHLPKSYVQELSKISLSRRPCRAAIMMRDADFEAGFKSV